MAPSNRRPAAPILAELLAAPATPDLHHRLASRLRALAEAPEGPTARAEVELALGLKWWGLRVLALQAMGRWATPRDLRFLTERANRLIPPYREVSRAPRAAPIRWQAMETEAARAALAPHLGAADAGWLLDLWFNDWLHLGSLYAALMRMPGEPVAARIRTALAGTDPEAREAALWLTFHHKGLPQRLDILRRLATDPHPPLARTARNLLLNAEAAAGESARSGE